MSISARNAHKIDLTTLALEDLHLLAHRLETSIADKHALATHRSGAAATAINTLSTLLPAYAQMLGQLAQAGGLDTHPVIQSIQAATAQGRVPEVPAACMLDDAPQQPAPVDIPPALHALMEEIQANPRPSPRNRAAIATTCAGLPTALATAMSTGLREAPEGAPQAIDHDSLSFEGRARLHALLNLCMTMVENIDMSLAMLRTDLRPGAYTNLAMHADLAAQLAQGLDTTALTAAPQDEGSAVDDAPF